MSTSSSAAAATAASHSMAPASLNKSKEFVACLGEFFRRDLISIPLIKKYSHSAIQQKCNIRAATLELDTSSYPNIEYIAGNRLSIYPMNPIEHVNTIMQHLLDDISPQQQQQQARKKIRMSQPWSKFVQINGKDSLRLALMYLYDIMTAPSRDLLRLMAENCTDKGQKQRLLNICKSDENWEKWICQNLRTLKSTLEEFNSCSTLSAKSLISELTLQQPRQYSISSIKSSKRFRTEIIVFQHKFTSKHVALYLAHLKDQENSLRRQEAADSAAGGGTSRTSSPAPSGTYGPMQSNPATLHVNHNPDSERSVSSSVRSLRSMVAYGVSPISTQQVKRVPNYSGPLMSLYASSTLNAPGSKGSGGRNSGSASAAGQPISSDRQQASKLTGAGKSSSLSERQRQQQAAANLPKPSSVSGGGGSSSSSQEKQFDGLCSNYLINLNPGDHIVCEFVENPRFTLKGNRERPIMLIGQDIGIVAFRPFWQQRALEYDRAQIFYTLFKDLSPKKFGELQLVCLTGNRCKVEDLFKREIQIAMTNKIISSVSYINRTGLINLLDNAAISSGSNIQAQKQVSQLKIESKELLELGSRISKLLIENNGCIYTCCDPQMTQAIEILVVESLARNTNLTRENIMRLIPKWKGRKVDEQSLTNNSTTNKFLYTLENPFERAQIVQEIYESSI